MTSIVTWNIQYGKGADGRIDLDRIAAVLRGMGPADVICLQEVARHVPELGDGAARDQPAELARLFPGYAPVFYPAVDLAGAAGAPRRQFGTMILSRLPVLQAISHSLPRPAESAVKHMQRQALEAVVDCAAGPLRVVTTHVQFDSVIQRAAQIEKLRELHREAHRNARDPPPDMGGSYAVLPRGNGTVLCGDFNFAPDNPSYVRLQAPFGDGTPALCDAWRVLNGAAPHPATAGLYDRAQWPQGPLAYDFLFVSEDIAQRVAAVAVDAATDASDHQPVKLELRD